MTRLKVVLDANVLVALIDPLSPFDDSPPAQYTFPIIALIASKNYTKI